MTAKGGKKMKIKNDSRNDTIGYWNYMAMPNFYLLASIFFPIFGLFSAPFWIWSWDKYVDLVSLKVKE